MIYTITQSPVLNRTVEVEEIIYDDINEIVEAKNSVGGKGIDISRVIKELGGQSVVLGFVGGYNGIEVEGKLVNEGIVCDFTRINDESQTKIIIYQRKKNLQTLLSTPEPEIKPSEVWPCTIKSKKYLVKVMLCWADQCQRIWMSIFLLRS